MRATVPKEKHPADNEMPAAACGTKVQPKLSVGAVNDPLEHEADSMADKVMSMRDVSQVMSAGVSGIQRKCAECEEEKVQRKPLASFIQRKESSAGTVVPDSVSNSINASKGSGSRMDGNTQSFMQSRFSTDFSNVKIHTGEQAMRMNEELNAKAFTVGNDIYFNEGQYNPDSNDGKHLLAHELTHTIQQGGVIRKMPKDQFGRPLGFVPTPGQEAYDQETYEINEWKKVLERLDKGELDDRDLANHRLRNRLTGLTSAEITALMTKIQDYQKKNPALSVVRILEWLEVRKEISTPMPDGSIVNRDPITNTIQSYSLMINNVKVTVLSDTFGNARNDTGPVSNFGKNYNWKARHNIVTRVSDTTSGTAVPVNPTSFEVTILTRYHDNPNSVSGYGKGTDVYDKEEKTTTLRVHEGKHGTDFIDYFRKNPFPVDLSKGVVGVLNVRQMRSIDSYISGITKETCEATDQIGFSQDEFLKTAQGKLSGITSCRKH